jgi:hypothetical protein
MGEQNEFIVIDEKPKRKRGEGVSIKTRLITIGFLLFLISPILFVFLVLFRSPPGITDMPWTVTAVVATNQRIEEQLTATRVYVDGQLTATRVRLEETATSMGLDVYQYQATQIMSDAAQTRSAIIEHTPLSPTQSVIVP